MTTGYRFELRCPYCALPTDHRADGTSDGRTARAIAQCPGCRSCFLITAELAPLGTKSPQAGATYLQEVR
jgi:hypothetical protein